MKNISMALCLLSIGFCLGCCPDKETPGLPPVTSEGKNTFACKINGEVFVADGSGTATPNRGIYAVLEVNFDSSGNDFPLDSCSLIILARSSTRRLFLYINPYLLKEGKKHLLNSITEEYPAVVRPKNYGRVYTYGHNYITSTVDTGSLLVTKWDQKKFIISGTFQFKAKNLAKKSETIEVTEGRFDLDYSKTR